jgi:predicted ATPase
VNSLGEVELKLLEGKTPIPARILSEGTLRILGMLALGGAKEPPALLGFEEPENGVHPRRIRHIAELLKTRANTGDTQIIATTHSPALLDIIPKESLYVCKKLHGQTQIRPLKAWARLFPLFQYIDEEEITGALNEEEGLTMSERILRGDFDA